MSWGHVVSRDLMHWEHLPVAFPEENRCMIFSGSVVVDGVNISNFGQGTNPPLAATFTAHQKKIGLCRISISPGARMEVIHGNSTTPSWTSARLIFAIRKRSSTVQRGNE